MTKLKSILATVAVAALLGACTTAGGEPNAETGASSQAAAKIPSKYVVFFRKKSVRLTENSEGVLFDAMQAMRMKKARNVRIIAYSMKQRNKRRSQQLASRRLDTLAGQLKKAGAKNVEVTDGGMLGAKETGGAAKARRAEIILQ